MNIRTVLFKLLLHVFKQEVVIGLDKIRQTQSLSIDEIKSLQEEKLRELLQHAYETVPYYQKVLKEVDCIDKNKRVKLENFSKIPILTKEIIRDEKSKLYSSVHRDRNSYINTSGGSTGEPIRIRQDQVYESRNIIASKLYFHEYFGKQPGEPEINLWGSERDIYENSLGWKDEFINLIYNRRFLNAFQIFDEDFDHFIEVINEFQPESIWTYVESIDLFAQYIEDNDLDVYSPTYIITTAGTLFPEVRQTVQRAFGSPVFNQYGSREVGPIGIECEEQDGMHTFPSLHYLEEVDGRLLVTVLTNKSMPLIRYDIGDVVSLRKDITCTCGRNTKMIQDVHGRVISHFINTEGESIHGQYFIHQFYYIDWIEKFKVVQESYEEIRCYIITRGSPIEKDLEKITARIQFVMGENCKVEYSFVNEIPASQSGKYLYTESHVR